jgi:tRNA1Val (adenine37-N6)-methyltransferase
LIFSFKQFSLLQNLSAMKVGTDGVLLGAWTPTDHNPEAILDIGTGTGLIALMLAQRTAASQIDALEIDEAAFEQATENFENSPWSDRLYCFHAGLDEFIEEPEELYDLLVCNPPFYTEDYKSGNAQRDTARFADAMPFEQLAQAASLLLADTGIFSVILPYAQEAGFVELFAGSDLYLQKCTRVRGTPQTAVKRSLMAFSRFKNKPVYDELVIETARHQYTPQYIDLTRDFYLKM